MQMLLQLASYILPLCVRWCPGYLCTICNLSAVGCAPPFMNMVLRTCFCVQEAADGHSTPNSISISIISDELG